MDQDIQVILNRVAELGEMSEAEARRIVQDVYDDGIVSRTEAEALFLVTESLSKSDPEWSQRFIGAVKDFLLTKEAPIGWITEEEADWLIAQIGQGDATPSVTEIDLMLSVLRYAEGAPIALSRYALSAISERIRAEGNMTSEFVERLRRVLYASAGEAGIWVSRYEATVLFELNDAIAFAKNDPSWNDLFARAVGNHLMASAHPDPQTEAEALSRETWLNDTSSNVGGFLSKMTSAFSQENWFSKLTYDPHKAKQARQVANEIAVRDAEQVTPDENAWFMKRLGRDQKVSPAERALIEFLKREAPGFTHGLTIAA